MAAPFRRRFGTVIAATVVGLAIGGGAIIHNRTSPSTGGSGAASVFISQNSAGNGNGSSCANAEPASFFNTSSNWGAGKPIAAGITVGLCGTVTTQLIFQADGTSGNPITLLFQNGAKISQPVCNCIDMNNRNWVTVDGGTNGLIEATDDGVGLGHVTADRGVSASPCSNCTVKNLTISNIFVMTPGASDPIDHTQSNGIKIDGQNDVVSNNTIHDVGWAIYWNNGAGNTSVHIDHNNIYHMDHGLTVSGAGAANVFINNNHFHDMGNWDCGGGCHHDGIHCYTVNGGVPNHYAGIYIYDNRFDGTVGSDNTAFMFMESNTGAGATPCADATSPIYVFNNVGHSTDHKINNGIFTVASGQVFAYNNTMVGIGNTNVDGYAWDCCAGNNGTGAFENNVMSTVNNFGGWLTAQFSPIDYNVYADAGGAGSLRWNCNGASTNTFATYQAGCGESHSVYNAATAGLNSSGVPQASSATLGAGTNLTSLCTGLLVALCSDINGNARPTSGSWDAGAFQVSGGGGTLTLANLWIDTNGGTCTRHASAATYVDAEACSDFQTAYSASAAGGDTIGIQPGTYGTGGDTNILQNGHSQAGPMTTFQCTTAHACTISGTLQLGRHAIGSDAPSFLMFDGIDIKNGQLTALPDNGQTQPTDVTFQNGHIYSWGDHGSLIWLSEYKNFTVRNVELGPNCCGGAGQGGDGIESGALAGSGVADSNWIIDGVHIHDIYDSCTAATAAMISLYGACSGSGFGDAGGSAQDHVDGIQLWGGVDGLLVENSKINNVDQTGGTAGQSFFIECSSGCIGYNNITLVNNMIGNSVNHDTTMGANCNTGCITGYVHIYYNTFQGRFNFASTTTNRSFANGTSIIVAGNIIGNTLSGCTVWTPAGTSTPTWTHNKIATGACGGSDITGSPIYVNSSAATLDLHLSGAQDAINGGEAIFCPATDFDTASRPINSVCDIGADEAG